jgi:hypothetical protein
MLSCEQVETLNGVIQHMDRDTVAVALAGFKARFPLDFTAEFYAREPITRLRHILFGLCLHNQKMLETGGD